MLGICIQHHFFIHMYIMQLELELYETSAKPFLNFVQALKFYCKSVLVIQKNSGWGLVFPPKLHP